MGAGEQQLSESFGKFIAVGIGEFFEEERVPTCTNDDAFDRG